MQSIMRPEPSTRYGKPEPQSLMKMQQDNQRILFFRPNPCLLSLPFV